MRKEKPLYLILAILFIAYVMVEYYSPKPIDWSITFSEKDRNPFGSFILMERMDDLFPAKTISFHTLPEMKDTEGNILILARNLHSTDVENEAIFDILAQGRSIFISTQFLSDDLLDTLGLQHAFRFFEPIISDSLPLHFNNETLYYPSHLLSSSFKIQNPEEWNVHAETDNPVLISRDFDGATLVLSSTPLVFTNYGMLHHDNHRFLAGALTLLPNENILYSRFYHSGKPEVRTPLRYFLSVSSLQWSVYLTLFVLILFLVFGSRRYQRIVPVIEPLQNTTVQYIKTIGGLYHREGNHQHAAQKIINHFLKALAEKYHITTVNESAYPVIASKTGVPEEDVIHTFSFIKSIKQAHHVSEETLKNLYDKIYKFKIH